MDPGTLRELEKAFRALSNVNRLRLVHELHQPRGYSDVELPPSRDPPSNEPQRSISRQAVREHVQRLADVGILKDASDEKEGTRRQFEVDRARLFNLMQKARQLIRHDPAPSDAGRWPRDPHLVLTRGLDEGKTYQLEEGSNVIGRDPTAEIQLGYDLAVRGEHARLDHRSGAFYARDVTDGEVGTDLNWEPLASEPVQLVPGDVLGVGESLLVYRSGEERGDE